MRRTRYTPSWHSRRKSSWLRNSLLLIFIGLPLALLVAELIARGVFLATGTNQLLPNKNLAIAQAYAFKLQDVNGYGYPGLPDAGLLQVRRNPILGYELIPTQSNEYWQINDQGFRQDVNVPLEKPASEIRVFLVGNSTAFTNMAVKNQKTLALKIEKLLNDRVRLQNNNPERFKPKEIPYFADQIEAVRALPPRIRDGNYRVITAAVPGYSSGNELSLVAHKVLAYSPNVLIILDGYEDLRSPSYQAAREIGNVEQMLRDPLGQYRQYQNQQFNNWLNSFYLMKAWQKWTTPSPVAAFLNSEYQIFNAEQLSKDPQEIQKRVDRYTYNLQQISRIAADIPTLIVLQPEITGKQKSLTKEEENILNLLGNEYRDRITNAYQIANKDLSATLKSPKFINFYQLFQESPQQAFIDPIHLTENANDLLAQKLDEQIERLFVVQPSNSPISEITPQPLPKSIPEAIATPSPPASLAETLQRVQGQ